MKKLTLKEKLFYRFFLNNKRVYNHWYSRFLLCGVELDRICRVISRIKNFYTWYDEWFKEGCYLENLAKIALKNRNINTARQFFHEAAGCYHIGQHVYFFDLEKKQLAQEKVRESYLNAITLYKEKNRPIKITIPFRNTNIIGYLRLSKIKKKPLIIYVNGADNLKEVENHSCGNIFINDDYNFFTFDGPGQGELWQSMKMIPDYEKSISTIIDWFENNNNFDLDLSKIGIIGFSLGGYLALRGIAFDSRISCAISIGGLGHWDMDMKVIPLAENMILHITGCNNLKEAILNNKIDIKNAPSLNRPMLFFQGGRDKLLPDPKKQADYVMDWASGEKQLKYYPDGDHCCANYLDEVFPYVLDWFNKNLLK